MSRERSLARGYIRFVLADIAAIATALGVIAAAGQLWFNSRQARAQFEHQFVQRFWALEDERLKSPGDDQAYAARYLRLCEDEFEARRLRQVSRATWAVWHPSIREGAAAFREARSGTYEWVGACLSGPSDHSAAECCGLRKNGQPKPLVERVDRPPVLG